MQKMKPNWVEGKIYKKISDHQFQVLAKLSKYILGFLKVLFKFLFLYKLCFLFLSLLFFLGLWMPKNFQLLSKENIFTIEAFLYYFLGLTLGEDSFTSTIVEPPITEDVLITRQFPIFCSFLKTKLSDFCVGKPNWVRMQNVMIRGLIFLQSVFFFCSSIASECKNSTEKNSSQRWINNGRDLP